MATGNSNKRLGLIGKDIDYSFSRGYFAKKFQKENLQGFSYENFDLPNAKEIPSVLQLKDLLGCNVTIPYKEAILPFLDELSPEAQAIGAVNTVVLSPNGKKIGHNTDCYGFENALNDRLSDWLKGALILGSGGASKAIKYVLEKRNIPYLVVSRHQNHGALTYQQVEEKHIANYPLIINCTPIGTYPNTEAAPNLPYTALTEANFLFDLVYNPAETTFLNYGKTQGAKIANGLKMLEYQAEKAWELWRG